MKNKRLTIAGMQVYFDDAGTALFDARGKERRAVELELTEYRDFIESWLDASEETRPRRVTAEEQQFRKLLSSSAKGLKGLQFGRGLIESTLREAIRQRTTFQDLTPLQIEESIEAAMVGL